MSKTFSIVLAAATAALAFATSDASVLRGFDSRKLSAAYAEAMDTASPLPEEARHLIERALGLIDGDSPDTSDSTTTAGSSTADVAIGSSDAIDISTTTDGSSDSTTGIQQEDQSKGAKYEFVCFPRPNGGQKCYYL